MKVIEWSLQQAKAEKHFKIFDPFMGSGTTAVACQSLGLEWCGCELEADYVAIANKRLEAVQGSLF
jgi:DNA modification methylase